VAGVSFTDHTNLDVKTKIIPLTNFFRVANTIRRQLTLFVNKDDAATIEAIRSKYNPKQRELINCHVTLCREDEIENIDGVLHNLAKLNEKPLIIHFGRVTRFNDGKGVLIPATNENEAFHELRKQVLKRLNDNPGRHEPHITLMHPRNSTCTDKIFEEIEQVNLPSQLIFNSISLIEQVDGGQWKILKTFKIPG